MFEFPVHEHFPPVTALEVHLENFQRQYFHPDNQDGPITPRVTTLTKYFELCASDDFARFLYYSEIPKYFTWKTGANAGWERRKSGIEVEGYTGIFKSQTLGRMHTVAPSQDEAFCLRLLLNEVAGPTSFADLKTVNGILHESFRAACRSRGLLGNYSEECINGLIECLDYLTILYLSDDDSYLNEAMVESSLYDVASKMRRLFVMILAHCNPSDPKQLWDNHKQDMASDILHRKKLQIEDYNDAVENELLIKIEDSLLSLYGKTLAAFNLPSTNREPLAFTHDWVRETSYPENVLQDTLRDADRLNPEQLYIFEKVKAALESNTGQYLFIDAPGGTGKTFLSGIILAYVRSQGKIAIAVASSGIAATLLQGGRTAHVVFKIPIDLKDDEPICNLSKGIQNSCMK